MTEATTYTPTAGIRVHCKHDMLADAHTLTPHPSNPNVHPPRQIELLAAIIMGSGEKEGGNCDQRADGGWREAIVVSHRSGYIIKGHGRLAAAMRIAELTGDSAVPIEYQHYQSEAEELADLVADNRIAELSALDMSSVGQLLTQVATQFPDFNLDMFALNSDERASLTSGWDAAKNPTSSGESNTVSRETVKVLVPGDHKDAAIALIKQALEGIPNVEVDP